ncbi:MAG: right-handed parallel beta-helix repeat-containing protein [Bacteroidota bacterium]
MKKLYRFSLLVLAVCFFQATGFTQAIFVKSNASGANNGTSWANAYKSLDAALSAATPGNKIWVAAGTYKPSTGANASFLVQSGIELYGGFAGTETSLSQRNITANPTILSGDLNGNDVTDSLKLNKSDNSWHVVEIGGDATLRTVVDGFTIRNGNTKVATADADLTKRGGGLQTTTPTTIRNCRFTQNAGLSGGAVAVLDGDATGFIADNCQFEKNLGSFQSAGIYVRIVDVVTIKNCSFKNNNATRGSLYPQNCDHVTVDSCLFEGNKGASTNFGGGMFTWQSNFVLKNSIFRNNTSGNAAGMYNDGRDHVSSFSIENCLFDTNTATNYGGSAVFNNETECTIKNCTFTGNIAPSSGAAMYNGNAVVSVIGSTFENNQAGFGGGIANYGEAVRATLTGNTFTSNKANTSGGAVTNGFLAQVEINDCTFASNNAKYGGAIFNQNDSTALTINGSTFSENNADNYGGAINVSAGIKANISTTQFIANSANYGGAIEVSEDSLDLSVMTINRCIFKDNLVSTQGGAINIDDADVTIKSSLIAGNTNFGTGAGGAISSNGAGKKIARLTAINTTFAGNVAALGAGIAQYAADSSGAELTLQNCIFSNIGTNYEIESGTPTVTSHGGNLSSDNTLTPYGNAALDIQNGDPSFVDDGNGDFHLKSGSPCINKGVALGASTVDLEGKLPNGVPDIGCYEFNGISGTHNLYNNIALTLLPNPAVEYVQSAIQSDWTGTAIVEVYNAAGKLVRSMETSKTGTDLQVNIIVKDFPTGNYTTVILAGKRYVGRFIKS